MSAQPFIYFTFFSSLAWNTHIHMVHSHPKQWKRRPQKLKSTLSLVDSDIPIRIRKMSINRITKTVRSIFTRLSRRCAAIGWQRTHLADPKQKNEQNNKLSLQHAHMQDTIPPHIAMNSVRSTKTYSTLYYVELWTSLKVVWCILIVVAASAAAAAAAASFHFVFFLFRGRIY